MNFLVFKKIIINFKNEWKKILASLVIALIFWYSISKFEYVEKKVYLPILYRNLSSNLIIVEGMETNTAVIIKAKEDFFDNQNYTNLIKPIVYLENAKIGINSYPIDIILNTPVQDISVKLQKDEIKLVIDELVSKDFEIKPNITGIPLRGYFVDDLILETQKIKIIGPKKVINSIDFIQTEPVSVDGLNLSLITNINLLLPHYCYSLDKTNISLEIKILPLSSGLDKFITN
ncbi:MAG: YbbR-like domain-containing protein [Brevinematales bacterium]|nr:YbbR-like domain-containing protein [Brevinematales bacterium]